MSDRSHSLSAAEAPSRRFEGFVFLSLSVLIWPFIAIGTVGAFGFAVWMYQILSQSAGS